MFESLLIFEIYILSALIKLSGMAAKMIVINDKKVQNKQMAVISFIANFWTITILITL